MKQLSSIRSLLGISQSDMAQLLQVHRSQLSMFESGKRDLPRAAKVLLAPMLEKATQDNLKQAPVVSKPDPRIKEYLKELMQENELQRLRTAYRLQNIRTLYQKNTAILNLTEFLSETAVHRPARFNKLVQVIRAKASNSIAKFNPLLQLNYEIKLELLELEKQLLEKYIAKHTNDRPLK